MNLETVLRDKVKPELNFLYTEPPALRDGGSDFGWFCREHAYHGLLVAMALGFRAQIRRGHVSIREWTGEPVASTFGEDCDHAWLAVDEVCPVDLSLTLKHLAGELPPIGLVYGQGPRGDYEVSYAMGDPSEPKPRKSRLHTKCAQGAGVARN